MCIQTIELCPSCKKATGRVIVVQDSCIPSPQTCKAATVYFATPPPGDNRVRDRYQDRNGGYRGLFLEFRLLLLHMMLLVYMCLRSRRRRTSSLAGVLGQVEAGLGYRFTAQLRSDGSAAGALFDEPWDDNFTEKVPTYQFRSLVPSGLLSHRPRYGYRGKRGLIQKTSPLRRSQSGITSALRTRSLRWTVAKAEGSEQSYDDEFLDENAQSLIHLADGVEVEAAAAGETASISSDDGASSPGSELCPICKSSRRVRKEDIETVVRLESKTGYRVRQLDYRVPSSAVSRNAAEIEMALHEAALSSRLSVDTWLGVVNVLHKSRYREGDTIGLDPSCTSAGSTTTDIDEAGGHTYFLQHMALRIMKARIKEEYIMEDIASQRHAAPQSAQGAPASESSKSIQQVNLLCTLQKVSLCAAFGSTANVGRKLAREGAPPGEFRQPFITRVPFDKEPARRK
ncbi:hypothetical protein V8F20_003086, partial [Naviculisporaceae sp. PSN 640]